MSKPTFFPRTIVAALAAALLVACGTNPVTGKREIQFISEAQELRLGEQHYAPSRQGQGGDLTVLPELTAYVSEVGQKLAAVADRPLPYEFTVLNSSVPNAWALPGGKIALNRGLLTELRNEAELAAVLGHEIVHAAARHGARAQERATLLTAGLLAAQVGAVAGDADQTTAGLLIGAAAIGAQLVQTRYGREQELESDRYGMEYMRRAGYDLQGAITLQETFVRLSEGRRQNWLEGLFASHPPSPERVARNRETAAQLGAGGELGAERYAARIAPLLQLKPAYDKADQALAALQKKDYGRARALAGEAAKAVPREGRFQQLLGDIALAEGKARESLPYYERAIELDPGYFGAPLGAGIAQYRLKSFDRAQELLARSQALLPTAPAAYYLGNMARDRGDTGTALRYYQAASGASSQVGREATAELLRIDLPRNPGNYVQATVRSDSTGRPVAAVQNRSPVALRNIRVTPLLVNAAGQVVRQGNLLQVAGPVGPGQQVLVEAGLGELTPDQLRAVRFRVEGATPAQ